MTIASPVVTLPGHYWSWRGFKIYYVKAGVDAGKTYVDRPALLLVHGFGASTDHWKKNIAGLQSDFEVYAIDLLGFGRSDKAETQYGGDLWADQLYDFIQTVIGKPTVIAGNSIGGYVALATTARFPEVAKGAILLNPAGGFSEDLKNRPQPSPLQKLIGTTFKTFLNQDWFSWFIFKYVQNKAFIRKTLKQVYVNQAEVTDELVEDIYRPSCDRGAAKVFALVFRAPKGESNDSLLQKLTQPLYLLWGEQDPWVGNARQRGAKFSKYYPKAQQDFIPAGHCPHDDAPELVNQKIREWLLKTF
ncbi:alpha/beta fold hydrolase [Alkalinema pantanalense CENA528]|uniref:alpha/beta fold hydrolase n=1 Tax=Alkalinema pantanalense TaxID=1620705 RepID=UPI003D6FB14A